MGFSKRTLQALVDAGLARWEYASGCRPSIVSASAAIETERTRPNANTPRGETTTVDLVIRLTVEGSPAEVSTHLDPLYCLADVMAVQAEDGLWSLGSPEAETDDGPSEHIAEIKSARVQAILIEGLAPTST
jgi:hypothetical protein